MSANGGRRFGPTGFKNMEQGAPCKDVVEYPY